jgi:hypothetical protein
VIGLKVIIDFDIRVAVIGTLLRQWSYIFSSALGIGKMGRAE